MEIELPPMRDCRSCDDHTPLENLNDDMLCPECRDIECPNCGSEDVKRGAVANPRNAHKYGCRNCGIGWD